LLTWGFYGPEGFFFGRSFLAESDFLAWGFSDLGGFSVFLDFLFGGPALWVAW
jgi:hypothetical protein